MASNSFGNIFRITTWGESHGKAIGVVIDGCPAGLEISEEIVNKALAERAPGKLPYTSPRKEPDQAQILSGIFEGKTTGAPISIIIWNQDVDSTKYEAMKNVARPGHANFTYQKKYGIVDHRGGGRASARETACRVAAAAVAQKYLDLHGITITAQFQKPENFEELIEQAIAEGDSIGGIVAFQIDNLSIGLGEPIYNKFEAMLADAMLSIPASKGFEIGEGFAAAMMKGSQHNDAFVSHKNQITTATNHAGGTLGGITTGLPILGRVAFKPPSSIKIPQQTTTLDGKPTTLKLPEGSRHDPCVAIRAAPVVKAMATLVVMDSLLLSNL